MVAAAGARPRQRWLLLAQGADLILQALQLGVLLRHDPLVAGVAAEDAEMMESEHDGRKWGREVCVLRACVCACVRVCVRFYGRF